MLFIKYSRNKLMMTDVKTPDWNDRDKAICLAFDEAVKRGEVTYEWVE